MPYPSQINPDQIIATATEMIERDGVESLSLAKLAEALGVKAPSLYRYFDGKTALLRAVNTRTIEALNTFIRDEGMQAPHSAHARLKAMADAYRSFAHAHPATLGLAYTNTIDDLRPDTEDMKPLSLQLESIIADFFGREEALNVLRGLWAIAHGFVMLELCGQFWRGGNYDAVFERIVEAYIAGWG